MPRTATDGPCKYGDGGYCVTQAGTRDCVQNHGMIKYNKDGVRSDDCNF